MVTNIYVILGDGAETESVQKVLSKIEGYAFTCLTNHSDLLKILSARPQHVLNFCVDGYKNRFPMELHIPALLDVLEIPYTGSGPACLAVCNQKALVSAHSGRIGIPVPREFYVQNHEKIPKEIFFPALIKPVVGGGSLGITEHSLVKNKGELKAAIERMKGTPFLIQEFLPGREYTVGLIGNKGNYQMLPILEMDYTQLPPELPPILTYASKWEKSSPYWEEVGYKIATLDEAKMQTLMHYSIQLFESLECNDYARFDFREDAEGEIHLLDVNANPDWCLTASFGLLKCHQVIEMILKAATDRWSKDGSI